MGTIKDLVDLVTQLNSNVEDRKFANELRQVQSMISAIQSEHAEIHEKRIDLMTENAELKQVIASLKEEIVALKSQKESMQTGAQDLSSISQDEQEILIFLTKASRATASQIANAIGKNQTKTEFWVGRLRDLNMVSSSLAMNAPTSYSLKQGGREFLVENDLV